MSRPFDMRAFPFALMFGFGFVLMFFSLGMLLIRDRDRVQDLRVAMNSSEAVGVVLAKNESVLGGGRRSYRVTFSVTLAGGQQQVTIDRSVPERLYASYSVGSDVKGRMASGEFVPNELIGDDLIGLTTLFVVLLSGVLLVVASAYVPLWIVSRQYRMERADWLTRQCSGE